MFVVDAFTAKRLPTVRPPVIAVAEALRNEMLPENAAVPPNILATVRFVVEALVDDANDAKKLVVEAFVKNDDDPVTSPEGRMLNHVAPEDEATVKRLSVSPAYPVIPNCDVANAVVEPSATFPEARTVKSDTFDDEATMNGLVVPVPLTAREAAGVVVPTPMNPSEFQILAPFPKNALEITEKLVVVAAPAKRLVVVANDAKKLVVVAFTVRKLVVEANAA